MTNSTEVKEFYDNFTASRMLEYKLYGNPRIDRAVELISGYVNSHSKILDIGCGIGIVPEKIADKLDSGSILACDLGENNINYARKTIESDKIDFLNVDVVENFAEISRKLSGKVDLITMVDVIEHLPPGSYDKVFNNFSQVTKENGKLILAYPSPEYQVYLQKNNPEELQIIDEIIEIKDFLPLALKYGFDLEYFAYINIWQSNQYIHCVFSKKRPCELMPSPNIWGKFKRKIKKVKCRLLMPFLKAKYITKPQQQK